jgi:transposase-like protein
MGTDDLLSRRPRTKRVFSDADMARLRDLYYDPDVPLLDTADAFGVPMSTLMRWIIEMRWPRKSTGWRPAGMAQPTRPEPTLEAGAAPPGALPARREREASTPAPAATPLDPDRLAVEVAAHARTELAAMGESGGPLAANLSLAERKRRADIIASLARSIAHIDKSFEARAEREGLKRLVKKLQDKLYAYENAGLIEAQKLTVAALKAEFENAKG